jgi:hypothetical protein
MVANFPAEPWRLRGDMYLTLWRVPVDTLPAWRLPSAVRPLVVHRRCVVVTFWVDYRPGGTLVYHELLVALAVRHERTVAGSAVTAWVDSEQSLAGGRALWGIPKQLATITMDATADGRTVHAMLSSAEGAVHGEYRDRRRLPGRLPVRATLLQRRETGDTCTVPLRLTGRPAIGRVSLRTAPDSPLAFLNGLGPRLSLAMRDFRFTVGRQH